MGAFQTTTIDLIEFDDEVQQGLPLLIDDTSMAFHLGIRTKTLWWLVISRDKQYDVFKIPKSNGKSFRNIQSPKPKMKYVQKSILVNVLERLPLGTQVGAYVPGRSCMDTAKQHVGKESIISLDLKDFFPSITTAMIRNYFKRQGYGHRVSSLLASLMTYKNFVPQGAPTSGYIANLVAQENLDKPLMHELAKIDPGFVYTRYSDDIDISHNEFQTPERISEIMKMVNKVVKNAGLRLKAEKTHVDHYYRKQKVLGMVVNKKLNVDKVEFKRLQSIVHHLLCHGDSWQFFVRSEPMSLGRVITYAKGKIQYYSQINPDKANKLKLTLDAALANLPPEKV